MIKAPWTKDNEELPVFYRLSSGAYVLACLPYYKLVPKNMVLYIWICFTSYMNDQKHLFRDTTVWRYIDRVSASLGMFNLIAQFILHRSKVTWSMRGYFLFCILIFLLKYFLYFNTALAYFKPCLILFSPLHLNPAL